MESSGGAAEGSGGAEEERRRRDGGARRPGSLTASEERMEAAGAGVESSPGSWLDPGQLPGLYTRGALVPGGATARDKRTPFGPGWCHDPGPEVFSPSPRKEALFSFQRSKF